MDEIRSRIVTDSNDRGLKHVDLGDEMEKRREHRERNREQNYREEIRKGRSLNVVLLNQVNLIEYYFLIGITAKMRK
jgi:hypothetical protein